MKKEKIHKRNKKDIIEKIYDWYEKRLFVIGLVIFIILAIISYSSFIVISLPSFADYSDEYKSMSQAFEENREYIEELLNPDTKISMQIDDGKYEVYSDEKHSININVANKAEYLIDSPSICYTVTIDNGEYTISDDYYNTNMSFGLKVAVWVLPFLLITCILLWISVMIIIIFELILEKIYD